MAFVRGLKRRAQALVLPTIFFALCGYFAHHAMHGTRGLIARDARHAEIAAARIVLAEAEAGTDGLFEALSRTFLKKRSSCRSSLGLAILCRIDAVSFS